MAIQARLRWSGQVSRADSQGVSQLPGCLETDWSKIALMGWLPSAPAWSLILQQASQGSKRVNRHDFLRLGLENDTVPLLPQSVDQSKSQASPDSRDEK